MMCVSHSDKSSAHHASALSCRRQQRTVAKRTLDESDRDRTGHNEHASKQASEHAKRGHRDATTTPPPPQRRADRRGRQRENKRGIEQPSVRRQ
jgi:hypothetical protein